MWKHLGPGWHSTFLPSCWEIISTLRCLTCYEGQPSLTCCVLTLELTCKGILKHPYWFHYNGSFAAQWPQSWSFWWGWACLGSASGSQLCRAGSGASWFLPSLFLADFCLPPSPRPCYSIQLEFCNRGRCWGYFSDLLLLSDFSAVRGSSQGTKSGSRADGHCQKLGRARIGIF